MTSDNITVIMKPTNQCNLRCKYCYHADNGYDKERYGADCKELLSGFGRRKNSRT